MMNGFKTATPDTQTLDPYTRVNYTLGLVLGVDEFDQEQLYLMNRDRLHNRLLHGYGTVCGLGLLYDQDQGEITVSAGAAVNPKGDVIRVPAAQCADLVEWIGRNQSAVDADLDPSGNFTAYITLCSRECETDLVPIPGAPCRTQEEAMAASRIVDDFRLSITLDRPAQTEEEAVRDFGDLLGQIEVSDQPGAFATPDQLRDAVLALNELASPPDASSPPDGLLRIHASQACEMLSLMFRVWVTEVRPTLLPEGQNCATGEPLEDCVLLAELLVTPQAGGNPLVTIGEENRPMLIHTRLLQEWMLCGRFQDESVPARTFATLSHTADDQLRAWVHYPDLLDIPPAAVNVVIETDAGEVVAPVLDVIRQGTTNVYDIPLGAFSPPGGLPPDSRITVAFDTDQIDLDGTLLSLAEALETTDFGFLDHEGFIISAYYNYWLSLGDLTDVNTGAAAAGNLLAFDGTEWLPVSPPDPGGPPTGPAGGDLGGSYPDPRVMRIRNRPVASRQPQVDEVLTWVSTGQGQMWSPRPAPTGVDGNFVFSLPMPYAIIGAGIFGRNGEPLPDANGNPIAPYGEIKVEMRPFVAPDRAREFVYLIRSELIAKLREGNIPLIVKGTVIDGVNEALELLRSASFHVLDPEVVPAIRDVNNQPVLPDAADAIVVFIWEPAIVEMALAPERRPLTGLRTNRAFMVEISAYGEDIRNIFA